jgi:DNA-binding NarL/FixJ family response regulator
MTPPVRVLLADDHTIMRASLKALLSAEPDLDVVGEAADGEEAVRLAAQLAPDVVVMDLNMPRMDGFAATAAITNQDPSPAVLILTMQPAAQFLLCVLEVGAAGYVEKGAAATDLITAVRMVARGEPFLYPSGVALLLHAYRQGGPAPREELTGREREVLTQTVEGYTATEIARLLHLSPKTVEVYRQRIMNKLGLHHRTELVRYALRTGLLRGGDGASGGGSLQR